MTSTDATARATVVAGMELIRWACDAPAWRRWCQGSEASAGPASAGPALAAGSILGAAAFAAMVPFPPLQILVAAGGLGLAGAGLADWRLAPRDALPPSRLDPTAPLETVLTTTGLLYGELAFCWEAHKQRLVYTGIGGSGPLYLLFRFRVGSWLGRRRVEVRLPVPTELEQDATDAARSIRRRLNPEDAAHLFRLEARREEAQSQERHLDSR